MPYQETVHELYGRALARIHLIEKSIDANPIDTKEIDRSAKRLRVLLGLLGRHPDVRAARAARRRARKHAPDGGVPAPPVPADGTPAGPTVVGGGADPNGEVSA